MDKDVQKSAMSLIDTESDGESGAENNAKVSV